MAKTDKYLRDEQKECLMAVQKINNEMHEKEGWSDHDTLLSMTICSYYFSVHLNIHKVDTEIVLFNSEYDTRIYYEKSDKYEEFYTHLKRKFREVKKKLSNIKL